MIPWLTTPTDFPPIHQALETPNGLLAAGGALTPEWILSAYRKGIFPWYSEEDPILWWSPDPRMVLFPQDLRISRSLRRILRSKRFEVSTDSAFSAVIDACAAPRKYAKGTWLLPDMQRAYIRLHELGWAHSIECWRDAQLVGGLYGLAIGQVFFGESMFHRETDASKVAFAHLVRTLEHNGFTLLDCQMSTPHLASLGAREVRRATFAEMLERAAIPSQPGCWPANHVHVEWDD